ncbi:hypothetical protein ACS0TY_002398 [Phlomoides rotata]
MGELPPYAYKHSKTARRKFRNVWHMDDEQSLIDCVKRLLLIHEIETWTDWNKLLRDVKRELATRMHHDYDLNDHAMKLDNLANFYIRFKLFVFKTPGVKFNFMTNQAIVDDTYWNYIRVNFGQEDYVHAVCHNGDYDYYQQCYYIFGVKDLDLYARDGPPVIRRHIPTGLNLYGHMKNHFVSYYNST